MLFFIICVIEDVGVQNERKQPVHVTTKSTECCEVMSAKDLDCEVRLNDMSNWIL